MDEDAHAVSGELGDLCRGERSAALPYASRVFAADADGDGGRGARGGVCMPSEAGEERKGRAVEEGHRYDACCQMVRSVDAGGDAGRAGGRGRSEPSAR